MDRFDDIWKNRFNEEEFSEGDWNTPDEEVWDAILPHVTPIKNRKPWWLIWLGVGLLSIVSFMFLKNNSENLVQEKDNSSFGTLISNESNSTYQLEKIEQFNKKELESTKDNRDEIIESNSMIVNISPSLTDKKKSIKNSKTDLGNNLDITDNFLSPGETTFTLSTISEIKDVILKNGIREITNKENFLAISHLNLLLANPTQIYPIQVSPKFDFEQKKLLPNNSTKLKFGVWTGAIFWQHRISDSFVSDLSPFDFNYKDGLGWQTSLNVEVGLNNYFDATVGFQFEQLKTTSGHNSNLTYNVLEEENPSNPLNGYALNLATPYGLSGATFNFQRGEDIVTDEVNLLVDFKSNHLIRNISLPVGINFYPLGKRKKIIPIASIGLGVNYLFNISNSIKSIDTHHDAIQFDDSGSSNFVSPDLESWHFDYRLGLGLKYELKRNLHLQLNYDWARGLNPIFKFENYNTRIDRHHFSVGLTKKIRME